MKLEIPDDIVAIAEANAADMALALAIGLYADNRISHQDACRLARVNPVEFNRELLSRQISVQQYPPALRKQAAG
jgi:predicted HTH domain antitoxin